MIQPGGARRGLDMWLLQRASALYIVLFLLVCAALLSCAAPFSFVTWQGFFQPLAMKVATLLFVGALLVHSWIGLREIFIDYLHCARCLMLRLALYFVFATLYLACLVWTVDILWSVK